MKSAKALLESIGYTFVKDGRCWFTRSPLNPDDNDPSFAIFPDGGWYCFSTRKGGRPDGPGSVESLSKLLHIEIPDIPEWIPQESPGQKPWTEIPSNYLDITEEQEALVRQYAESRGIYHGYTPAVYYTKDLSPRPSLMFLHGDGVTITGANFRDIDPTARRYTMRGKLGFYILEHIIDSDPQLYLVEGEINANSLWEYCKMTQRSSVILSAGSVSRIPNMLPEKYQGLKGSLLIDYDGSDYKWKQRVKAYNHLKLNPVKMRLGKGEDINSLWCQNRLHLIENLI